MDNRPILMSGPMVRAILEGRKSQTRRLAWRPFTERTEPPISAIPRDVVVMAEEGVFRPTIWQKVAPGDRLWVRETWGADGRGRRLPIDREAMIWRLRYGADSANGLPDQCRRSPIHMPRWASRLTLVVTETRMERLQEITPRDCMAEGILGNGPKHDVVPAKGWKVSFAELWESLHGPGSWNANPEVVAITFEPHHRNIDQMERAA